MKDEYIVKVFNDGTRHYYKNDRLHREIGPARLIPEDKEYFTDLSDEHLYKEVILDQDPPHKVLNNTPPVMYVTKKDGSVDRFRTIPIYYLEGQTLTNEEFAKIKAKLVLKNELSVELPTTESSSKKLKI